MVAGGPVDFWCQRRGCAGDVASGQLAQSMALSIYYQDFCSDGADCAEGAKGPRPASKAAGTVERREWSRPESMLAGMEGGRSQGKRKVLKRELKCHGGSYYGEAPRAWSNVPMALLGCTPGSVRGREAAQRNHLRANAPKLRMHSSKAGGNGPESVIKNRY